MVGWKVEPVEMDGYADFSMLAPGTEASAAGIGHARGGNAHLPAQWINYWIAADLDAGPAACRERGGWQLYEIRDYGGDRYCFIEDPAGAVCALYQRAPGE